MIKSLAIFGTGLMGPGIALDFAARGCDVRLMAAASNGSSARC